jgi:hypothetical protein
MSDQVTVGRGVLGRGNARRQSIFVEEWGGNVMIQQLSARQVSAIQQLAGEAVDPGKQQVRDRGKLSRFNFAMIRDSWIGEDGALVLSDADYDTLVDEPHAVIETLVNAISEFNNMSGTAVRDAKKNLEPIQNGVSPTSSR